MVVAPAPRPVRVPSGQGHAHSRLARWAVGLSAGFGIAFASSIAIVARIRRERWALLWLPLSLFPALFLFVMLGEVFWWE